MRITNVLQGAEEQEDKRLQLHDMVSGRTDDPKTQILPKQSQNPPLKPEDTIYNSFLFVWFSEL